MIYQVKELRENMTRDVANELWIAKDRLSKQGFRSDLSQKCEKSWGDYCKEIGVHRNSADNWLKKC